MKRTYTTLPYIEYSTEAFDSNRVTIDRVVIHSTVCTVQQAINTFSSPNAQTSAHYIIGNDGKLFAGLEEYYVAYHSGNYAMNQRSIGIEHEWYSGIHPTDALYKMSAALVKDICTFYGLPINSTTIIPHKQVVPTGCPNEIDVNRIISEANGVIPTPPVDDCPAKLTQITAERDRLNGVITGKDELITNLNQQISQKNASMSTLEAEKKSLADQLLLCSNTSQLHLEQANKAVEYKQQVDHLEAQKAEWITKEQDYIKQIKTLQTRNENLKKPVQKLVLAIAEKLGIQI